MVAMAYIRLTRLHHSSELFLPLFSCDQEGQANKGTESKGQYQITWNHFVLLVGRLLLHGQF